MKNKITLKILIFLVLLLNACSSEKVEYLSIATAANMQFAMEALASEFEKKTAIKCEIMVSSSGKLTAQITEGAPFDIFVSADMKFPNKLYKEGFTESKPAIYAYGKLILWTTKEGIEPTMESLLEDTIAHIAVANPKTAPYGTATFEFLENNKLLNTVKHKFVYGESVAQTNQFITTGAAEIGFTALSVVKSKNIKNKGSWLAIDENLYSPISQGIVVLKNDKSNKNHVKQFYNFLFSQEGKTILNKFGYKTDN
jgi:molybdate transport system substrate-binding protein